jgi:hypothetical protein
MSAQLRDPLNRALYRHRRRSRLWLWWRLSLRPWLRALATGAALFGGLCLLGTLLAWVAAGGPDGVPVSGAVCWARGALLGSVMAGAGAFGYLLGVTR